MSTDPSPALQTEHEATVVFRSTDGSSRQRLGRLWRKHRFWLGCLAAFVIISVLALLAGGGNQDSAALSPANPAPEGARATAEILRAQGVDVMEVDSLQAVVDQLGSTTAGSTTVLLRDPRNILSRSQGEALSSAVRDAAGSLVALNPGPLLVSGLSTDIDSVGSAARTDSVPASCTQPDAVSAGSIDGGSTLPGSLTPIEFPTQLFHGAQTCFPTAADDSAGYLAFDASGTIAAVGNAGILSNQNLSRQGNAALALRLLGGKSKLLWYTAGYQDIPLAQQAPSLAELTPRWIFPATSWLLLVAVIGMFWRGRRNGPLVPEPLPVIVKSSETLTGRARLYQDARAVEQSGRTLRHATLTRLAATLRLGHSANPEAVAQAAAMASGRKLQDVQALLLGPDPLTEKDMLSMAVALTALEEEVATR